MSPSELLAEQIAELEREKAWHEDQILRLEEQLQNLRAKQPEADYLSSLPRRVFTDDSAQFK